MNECKFRAWDKENKQMIYFTLADLLANYCDEFNYSALSDTPLFKAVQDLEAKDVMQLTGRHDKHGKPIYEGDIALLEGVERCVVVFWEGCFCYENSEKRVSALKETATHWVEVIGNIYEQPELISQSGGQ